MVLENQQILNAVLIFQDIKFLISSFHTVMVMFSCSQTNIFEREFILLKVRHSSKELHCCCLPGNSGHCECGEKHPLQCQIARTLNRQIRQPCPAYLYQDNNLHQDCSVPLTRRSRDRVRPAEVTMVKMWSNIDSNDLQCFPRGISWWQCFCACCHLPTGARGLNDV